MVAGSFALAFLLAGGLWWLLASTVSTGEYDEVVAELDAAEEALAASQEALTASEEALERSNEDIAAEEATAAELEELVASMAEVEEQLTEELADARAEVTELSAGNDEMRVAITRAREVAEAAALMELNVDSTGLDEFVRAGGDLDVLENLLVELGRDETVEEWAASWEDYDGAWAAADLAVSSTDDDLLIDFWRTWNWAELDSDEEYVAWVGMYARVYELLLERLTTVD